MSSPNSSFQERIEKLIALYNGNAMTLARDTGVTRSALEKWRKGQSEASRESLEKLAKGANISLTWLVTGEGDMFPPAPGSQATDSGNRENPSDLPEPDDPAANRFLELLEFFGPELDSIASRARVPRTRIEAFRNREAVPESRERKAIIRASGASEVWVDTGIGMLIPSARLPRSHGTPSLGSPDVPPLSGKTGPASPRPPLDPEELAALIDRLEALYKEAGAPCSAGLLGRRAAEIAQDVALIARSPHEAEIAIAMALLTIRRTL